MCWSQEAFKLHIPGLEWYHLLSHQRNTGIFVPQITYGNELKLDGSFVDIKMCSCSLLKSI